MNQQITLEATPENAQTNIEKVDAQNEQSLQICSSDVLRSLELAKSAEKLARLEGYTLGLAVALRNQAKCYRVMGDSASALTLVNDSKRLFEELGDISRQAYSLQTIGFIYANLGDHLSELKAQLNALKLFEMLGDKKGQANTLTNIGMAYSSNGDSRQAVEFYQRAIELFSTIGENYGRAIAYNSCCVDYTKLGEYDRAKAYGEQALQVFIEVQDEYGMGVARSTLGEVSLASKDFPTAIQQFEQALEAMKGRAPDLTAVEALETRLNLGKAYLGAGSTDKALDCVRAVLNHAEAQNLQLLLMSCVQSLSQIYEQRGELAPAIDYLKRYVEVREKNMTEAGQRDIHNLQIIHETHQAQAEGERQRKLREQDRESFERLAQIKNDFLHHATHDIKNPLSVINASSFLLKIRIPASDEKSHEYIDMMTNGVEKIRQLVSDILDLAKLEATPAVQTEPVALQHWLDTMLVNFKSLAEVKQISLTMQVEPPDLICKCNKQRFGQALENLLSNAIKYTQNGGSVRLIASKVESHLQIQVIDNGIGIPPEAMPRLFDRFYRVTSHTNGAEGTGLGLSIVKLSVEQHGGKVTAESTIGKGTTFTILLPL